MTHLVHRRASRPGFTLLELLVVLVILGVIATISAVSIGSTGILESESSEDVRIAEARRTAIRTRASVSIPVDSGGVVLLLTALPDGRIVASAPIGGLRLSGLRHER